MRPVCAWSRPGSPSTPARVRPSRRSRARTARSAAGSWTCCGLAGARSTRAALDAAWADAAQRDRCLDSLLVDGLAEQLHDGRFALPGMCQPSASGSTTAPRRPSRLRARAAAVGIPVRRAARRRRGRGAPLCRPPPGRRSPPSWPCSRSRRSGSPRWARSAAARRAGARAVVDAELLAVHAAVHDALAGPGARAGAAYLPGAWLPHCVLASTKPRDAFAALHPVEPVRAPDRRRRGGRRAGLACRHDRGEDQRDRGPEGAGPGIGETVRAPAHAVDNQPGFLSFSSCARQGRDRYFVVTTWDTEESFQAWMNGPAMTRTPASARGPSRPAHRCSSSRSCSGRWRASPDGGRVPEL